MSCYQDMGELFIGTSGYSYKNWKGDFYPEDLAATKFFNYYIEYFNSAEINFTFYSTPKEKTIENWLKKAPEGFVFVFKGSRFISHYQKLQVMEDSIHRFFNPFEKHIEEKDKHCVLWQMGANFGKNVKRVEHFINALPEYFRYAFEFRHETWFSEDVYDVLNKYNAALVLADSPKVNEKRTWPLVLQDTADFNYIRFHGSQSLYTSRYTNHEMKRYGDMIRKKLEKGHDVYAYFNNDAHGHAPHDALRLKEQVEQVEA